MVQEYVCPERNVKVGFEMQLLTNDSGGMSTCPAIFGFDKKDRASILIAKHTQATMEDVSVGIKSRQVCIAYKNVVYLKWTTQIIEFSAIFCIRLFVAGTYTQPI